MQINELVGTIYILAGTLLMVYGAILYARKLPRNHLVGFRMDKAMESKEAWYDINGHGGMRLLQTSWPTFFVGALSFFLEYDTGDIIFWIILLSPLLVIIALIDTQIHAGRI